MIASPLAKRIVKPLARGVVKASVWVVMDVKKCAQEARHGIQDLAAEVSADMRGGGQPVGELAPEKA
ncbi:MULTISPECIES: DUF5132 domain-containing protein [Kitasatospora]|uniref:DUF5132 domain-containing protein n=1 Tax=Kitasatospora TaxID=2063 RepID=UPI0031D164A6